MNGIGKGLAVGLTAMAACIVICVLQTEESLGVISAPIAVALFAYVLCDG